MLDRRACNLRRNSNAGTWIVPVIAPRFRTMAILAAAAVPAAEATGLPFEDFELPWVAVTAYESAANSEIRGIPVGPHRADGVPMAQFEGTAELAVLRIESGPPTHEIADAVSAFLEQNGYSEIFRCHAAACGGFDFQAAAGVASTPEMRIDLGDFEYVAAARTLGSRSEFVAAVASRGSRNGYLQLTCGAGAPLSPESFPQLANLQPSRSFDSLAQALETAGFAVIESLVFLPGSTALEEIEFAELRDLAEFLSSRPDARAVLVGHTDATGSLAANTELSLRRARSVRDRLVNSYGVDPAQLSVRGIGYLAPRETNETETGRNRNRRVEVVLMPRL